MREPTLGNGVAGVPAEALPILLGDIRSARALLQEDAEAFSTAVITLETVGRVLKGGPGRGLGSYSGKIIELATTIGHQEQAERNFEAVRKARNSAVHTGAWIRHVNGRLIELFLIIEEALVKNMKEIQDIMVREPVTAHEWQMLSDVRVVLLSNAFSSVPALMSTPVSKEWRLVTDQLLAKYLRYTENVQEKRGSQRLSEVWNMVSVPATTCREVDSIESVLQILENLPVLVLDDTDRLVGLVSASDLL